MIGANESLSKMTINSYNNPRKSHLLNIVKKIDAELISLIEDRHEKDKNINNNNKVSEGNTNRKISQMEQNNNNN